MPPVFALSLLQISLAKVRSTSHYTKTSANSESTRRPRPGHLSPRDKSLQACTCFKYIIWHLITASHTQLAQAKDAHVGVVKTYALPPTPVAPSVPSDLAAELSAYDAAEPTRAEVVAASSEAADAAGGADAFLSFLEQDLPKPEAHH